MLDPIRFAELKAAGRLPSPSGPALKLIELLGREDVALPEVVRLVQQDPALTGRVLKLANSAAFARPRPAAAISTDVLMMIGLPALRQLVLAFALIDGQRGGPCRAFDYTAFWSQAVARGAAAQTLAMGMRLAPPAELFTLGLVADIGRLALASLEPARFAELLAQSGADEAALIEGERARLWLRPSGAHHCNAARLGFSDAVHRCRRACAASRGTPGRAQPANPQAGAVAAPCRRAVQADRQG